MHREVSLYDDDPEVWQLERWRCGEEKKTAIYNALLTVSSVTTAHDAGGILNLSRIWLTLQFSLFGAGHRSCLRKTPCLLRDLMTGQFQILVGLIIISQIDTYVYNLNDDQVGVRPAMIRLLLKEIS